METKVCCRCYNEYSISCFGIYRRKIVDKQSGNIIIESSYRGHCNTCDALARRNYKKNNYKAVMDANKKYRLSIKGKQHKSVQCKRYALKYPEKIRILARKTSARAVDNLSFKYVKQCWTQKFKKQEGFVPEFTKQIWKLEQLRLTKMREMRKIAKQLKLPKK